jgi:hypothetical protein
MITVRIVDRLGRCEMHVGGIICFSPPSSMLYMYCTTFTKKLLTNKLFFAIKIKAEKTKYMLLSHHQNAGRNQDIKAVNRSFENWAQFIYFGMTVTNQNFIQEEIKR